MMAMKSLAIISILIVFGAKVANSNPCFVQPPPACGKSFDIGLDLDISLDVVISFCKKVFTKCDFVDNSDIDIYLKWIQKFNQKELSFAETLTKYLEVEECLRTEIDDYGIFKEKIFAAYEILNKYNVYSSEIDISSHTEIYEEVKVQISEAMQGLSKDSVMYSALDYCTESEITSIPAFVGLCKSVVMSQETYFSQTSTFTESSNSVVVN